MTESSAQAQNGALWLHELTYGTEKQLMVNNLQSLIDEDPEANCTHKWELAENEAKLSAVRGELQRLLGTAVIVHLLRKEAESETESITGLVRGFNLQKGQFAVKPSGRKRTIPYCSIEPHESYGHLIMPTITLFTEQEYKF